MYDRDRIDWRVPSNVWNRFREYVEDEFGELGGYLGREAERAMKEYGDADGYAEIEERVNQLVEAAGRTPGGALKEKNSLAESDRTRVTARVESSVKDEFREVASDDDDPYGVVLARALDEYMRGGRATRLERKLDRVIDDAEGLLAEASETSTDEGLSTRERRTIAISNELPAEFTDDELVDAIRDHGLESAPTIQQYRERVADHKGVEPHPSNPDIWVRHEEAVRIAGEDVPREARMPVEYLSRDERQRRVKLELGRLASQHDSGKLRVEVSDVRDDFLDNEVSSTTARDIMSSVGRDPGFSSIEASGSNYLRANLDELAGEAPDLCKTILDYRDSEKESPSRDAQLGDFTGAAEADVTSEFDRLASAQPARADGGIDSSQ